MKKMTDISKTLSSSMITSTPFNEYREEQSGIRLVDYFVQPDLFDQLSDNRPKLLFGSRGTGKTTILKAMTLEQTDDKEEFLKTRNYIGFYYKVDLNISNAFYNTCVSEATWHNLFSYFFACCIAVEVFQQVNLIKGIINADEETICKEVSAYFELNTVKSFSELISEIRKKEKQIEIYINNIPYKEMPTIGAFSSILKELPNIIISNSESALLNNKHFVYLIDEFESLKEYQQKAIFSLVKYADHTHTYIIGLRPLGLKILSTIGEEYIRETDDFTSFDLDEDKYNYQEFAKKVCDKRIELFYRKYIPTAKEIPTVDSFFCSKQNSDDVQLLFKNVELQAKHVDRVRSLLDAFGITETSIQEYLSNNQEQFYFLVLKLIKERNRNRKITKDIILKEIIAFKDPDKNHKEFIQNYRTALTYYIYHLYGKKIPYASFHALVQLSGHTLRYLLEMSNEIFLRMYRDDNTLYEQPRIIPVKIQSDEIFNVSLRRFEQIRAVPDIGPRMQQFMKALGIIASAQHEDSRLAKWEPNHFSIKPDSKSNEDLSKFLTECVFRGVLLQFEDNKIKMRNTISFDQYMYQIHPIYSPKFQISSRKKQKMEFTADEMNIMIGNDILEINKLIQKERDTTLSNKIKDIIDYLKNQKTESSLAQRTLFDYLGQGE